jgi:hypothetical protein
MTPRLGCWASPAPNLTWRGGADGGARRDGGGGCDPVGGVDVRVETSRRAGWMVERVRNGERWMEVCGDGVW